MQKAKDLRDAFDAIKHGISDVELELGKFIATPFTTLLDNIHKASTEWSDFKGQLSTHGITDPTAGVGDFFKGGQFGPSIDGLQALTDAGDGSNSAFTRVRQTVGDLAEALPGIGGPLDDWIGGSRKAKTATDDLSASSSAAAFRLREPS